MNKEEIREYLEEGAKIRKLVNVDEIHEIGIEIAERMVKNNGIFLIFGNGGSAADAQHIAEEFSGMCDRRYRRPLASVALTTNTSVLTAFANDFGYDEVFARQIRGFATEKDVVIGISTSGNAMSVIKGIEEANKIGCFTIAFTGKTAGNLRGKADRIIRVESTRTPLIQEVHITIGHILSKIVEDLIE